jgi:hypothetical protein
MVRMRAKFKIDKIESFTNGEQLTMAPVYADTYGPQGENEDNDFARYTPSGQLTMTVTNPNLINQFKEGDKYYIDFTKAE